MGLLEGLSCGSQGEFQIVRGQGEREVWERTGRARETGVCACAPDLVRADAEETGFREVALTQERQESSTGTRRGALTQLRWSESPSHRSQSGPLRGPWLCLSCGVRVEEERALLSARCLDSFSV